MSELLIDLLSEVLVEVGSTRGTCLARISTRRGLRAAFFEDGNLVYFASDDPSERLADFLTGPDRLDDPVSRALVAGLDQPNRSIVVQLLEAHVCTPEQLKPWLVEYAHMCFARAFDDGEGTVRVMPKAKAQHPVEFSIPAAALALESVRRMTDEALMRQAIGLLDWEIEPTATLMERLMQVPVNYQEGIIGSQLTARMKVRELVTVSNLAEDEALRAILALRVAGVIPRAQEPKTLTDSGRLRMRREAIESGVEVDREAAAMLALGMARSDASEDVTASDGALSMDELAGQAAPRPAAQQQQQQQQQQPQSRPAKAGNSGQLRLLASAYVQLAEAEAAAGNYNGAVRYYEQALSQKPSDLTVILPFAKYLLTFKKPAANEAAERLLKQGCIANPGKIEPRVELVRAYRTMGRHAQAQEALAEAERLSPRHPAVQELLTERPRGGGGLFARLRGGA
jgi:tetratricopeptide (TPR) repeat protein